MSAPNLEKYRAWLLATGRAPTTAATYCRVLAQVLGAGSPEGRLVDRKLAPKTRGVLKFALKSWYRFSKQPKKVNALDEIRLPPLTRRGTKAELPLAAWRALVAEIQRMPTHKPGAAAVQCVLLMMGLRGFRIGDVLRMTRREVAESIRDEVISFEGKGGKRLIYDTAMVKVPMQTLLNLGADQKWATVVELCAFGAAPGTGYMRCHRALKACAKQAKLTNVHIHRLRRTYATHYLKFLKNDPQALIKLQHHMGWSNITTAALYADHVTQADLADNAHALITELLEPTT